MSEPENKNQELDKDGFTRQVIDDMIYGLTQAQQMKDMGLGKEADQHMDEVRRNFAELHYTPEDVDRLVRIAEHELQAMRESLDTAAGGRDE